MSEKMVCTACSEPLVIMAQLIAVEISLCSSLKRFMWSGTHSPAASAEQSEIVVNHYMVGLCRAIVLRALYM